MHITIHTPTNDPAADPAARKIFLAGTEEILALTPETVRLGKTWQQHAIDLFRAQWVGRDPLAIYCIPGPHPTLPDLTANLIQWRTNRMREADVIAFHFPPWGNEAMRLRAAVEWGRWMDSGKVTLAATGPGPREWAEHAGVPVVDTVSELATVAVSWLDVHHLT